MTRNLAAVAAGAMSVWHLLVNAHSLLMLFDSLASARIVFEPLGLSNMAAAVVAAGCVFHGIRTWCEYREKKRSKR